MKIARHSKIIELINQYDIETQEELADKLQEAGYKVTQATISRDIRELKLTKNCGWNRTFQICGSRKQESEYE